MTSTMKSFQDKLDKKLHQVGMVDDLFTAVEVYMKVKRLTAALGMVVFVLLWLAFGWGAQLLANTIGFLYPAFCSLLALVSCNKKDDTQWLKYWVVFASFSIIEYFADFVSGLVPFYWVCKCLLMVWCMAPTEDNGSAVIYAFIIRPMFKSVEKKAESPAVVITEDLFTEQKSAILTKVSNKVGMECDFESASNVVQSMDNLLNQIVKNTDRNNSSSSDSDVDDASVAKAVFGELIDRVAEKAGIESDHGDGEDAVSRARAAFGFLGSS